MKIKQWLYTVCGVSSVFCLWPTKQPYDTTRWTDKEEKEDSASMISESDDSSMEDVPGTISCKKCYLNKLYYYYKHNFNVEARSCAFWDNYKIFQRTCIVLWLTQLKVIYFVIEFSSKVKSLLVSFSRASVSSHPEYFHYTRRFPLVPF